VLGLDALRQRGHVEKQDVLDLSHEHAAWNCAGLPRPESEEGGRYRLQGETVEHLRRQDGVPYECGGDQLAQPWPRVPGPTGKDLVPGLCRARSVKTAGDTTWTCASALITPSGLTAGLGDTMTVALSTGGASC
jgi:hypothetical protein